MPDTRRDKLLRMAERGGTENERAVARKMLAKLPEATTPPPKAEGAPPPKWFMFGKAVAAESGRSFDEYALRALLPQIRDGVPFTMANVHRSDDLTVTDFHTILVWIVGLGLCTKAGARYTVRSKVAVATAWNEACERMKIRTKP